MDEADLIKKIIQGERTLFRILVEKYKDISLTIAYSIVKNQEEAEDVTQESFMKAFRNLSKFNFRSSFKTWFYRIVVNTSYDSVEKNKIRKTIPLIDQNIMQMAPSQDGYDRIRSIERKKVILSVLSELSTNDALLLQLFYLGEQSYTEIVEITGISLSNVKVILHRARKKFQMQLMKQVGKEIDELL